MFDPKSVELIRLQIAQGAFLAVVANPHMTELAFDEITQTVKSSDKVGIARARRRVQLNMANTAFELADAFLHAAGAKTKP